MIKLIIRYIVMTCFSTLIFWNQCFATELELDVGINTKYKLETKETWRGYDRISNADLNGNDIRFVYGADNDLSWVIRYSDHQGETPTSSAYFTINLNEITPFVRYDHPLFDNDDWIVEGQIAAGFNLYKTTISYPSFETKSTSGVGFMLEPSIFTGLKNENLIFGLGLNLPFDTYKDNVEWIYKGSYLTYNYSITKTPALYLIIRFPI